MFFLISFFLISGSSPGGTRYDFVTWNFTLGKMQHFLGRLTGYRCFISHRTGNFAANSLTGSFGHSSAGSRASQFLTVSIPVGCLNMNLLNRLRLRHVHQRILIRLTQDFTHTDTIHVCAVELIDVGAIQGNQHTFQADILRLDSDGNFVQGIATFDGNISCWHIDSTCHLNLLRRGNRLFFDRFWY